MEAHLTVVAESRDRIPAPCEYCKAASAAAADAADAAAAEAAKKG